MGVEQLIEKDYPQIAAVGMAAAKGREPRIVDIRWNSPLADAEPIDIVIIGKGITFDTGGLNIKGGGGMRNMKRDMAGSAQALALALWIVETKLPVRVRLLLPIAENSISGIALRPGNCYHDTTPHNPNHPHTTYYITLHHTSLHLTIPYNITPYCDLIVMGIVLWHTSYSHRTFHTTLYDVRPTRHTYVEHILNSISWNLLH